MVYLFLADGFEIIEALSPVDMLRRANIDVKTVGVTGKNVTSSCGITVSADIDITDVDMNAIDAVILPGGAEGVENLDNNNAVHLAIDTAVNEDKYVCAICAAPSILGKKGILDGVEATAYPTFMKYLKNASASEKYVVTDGKFITARGAGVSVEFGLEIVKALSGDEEANRVKDSIQCL
ncbi:MAG: DJ-1/PfpI family protein [Acetobacter sp.]|nr:DJ-1/PfpI family protein [Bacteroides sp.]MCM1340508.1 DJ-1/PfpI family protein [Acetobacter sp.]MCM1433248.1 DJ-1/PfpI family protein [Clostridiales bacterium]